MQFTFYEISGDLHNTNSVTVGNSGTALVVDDLNAGDTALGSGDTAQFSINGTVYDVAAYGEANGYEVEVYHGHLNGGGVITFAYLTASGDTIGDNINRITILSGSVAPGDSLTGIKLVKGQSNKEIEYETIPSVICFTPGTLITTPKGQVLVEYLQAGDLVITADNGLQAVRWIGRKHMSGARLHALPNQRPIRIRQNAFGNGTPTRDMWVSPQHRMLIKDERAQLMFGEAEMLVPAKALVNDLSIAVDYGIRTIEYIHVLFDQHEIIFANGALTESFHPGTGGINGLDPEARTALFDVSPILKIQPEGYGPSARPSLKPQEVNTLIN